MEIGADPPRHLAAIVRGEVVYSARGYTARKHQRHVSHSMVGGREEKPMSERNEAAVGRVVMLVVAAVVLMTSIRTGIKRLAAIEP